MLRPWEVIPAALAAGALTPHDVVHRGVFVDQVGRSHAVYRVSIAAVPAFYLKCFGPSRGATDGSAERERAVQALAHERAAVARLVAPPWPWNTPGSVVATAALDGSEAWRLDHLGGGDRSLGDAWAALVSALAAPLAELHRATRDLARPGANVPDGLEPREPWALCLMDGDAAPELWATESIARWLRVAAADPALVAGLRAARALWRPLALVHADLKHDNVVVTKQITELEVRVLDWEMARIGDPAWDLAALTARLVAAEHDAPPWSDAQLDGAALLVARYSAASGLHAEGLAHRLVHYCGAVLLAMSLQHASHLAPGADTAGAADLVRRARATFAQVDVLRRAIVARAGGLAA